MVGQTSPVKYSISSGRIRIVGYAIDNCLRCMSFKRNGATESRSWRNISENGGRLSNDVATHTLKTKRSIERKFSAFFVKCHCGTLRITGKNYSLIIISTNSSTEDEFFIHLAGKPSSKHRDYRTIGKTKIVM